MNVSTTEARQVDRYLVAIAMEGSELGIVDRGFGSWHGELGGEIHDLKGFPGVSEKVGRRGDREENSV